MKRISIRQFQRNFYKELKDVPFIVIRQVWEGEEGKKQAVDKPEFIVSAYKADSPLLETEQTPEGTVKLPFVTSVSEEKKEEKPGLFKRIFSRTEKPCNTCQQLENNPEQLAQHRGFWHK